MNKFGVLLDNQSSGTADYPHNHRVRLWWNKMSAWNRLYKPDTRPWVSEVGALPIPTYKEKHPDGVNGGCVIVPAKTTKEATSLHDDHPYYFAGVRTEKGATIKTDMVRTH